MNPIKRLLRSAVLFSTLASCAVLGFGALWANALVTKYWVIRAQAESPASVFSADLDGDGDMDVLSASLNDNRIAWYENDGRRKGPCFIGHTITTDALIPWSVSAVDLDGDADVDVLVPSWGDDKIAWHENVGGSPPVFVEHVLSEDPDGAGGPLEGFSDGPALAEAGDLDGDGDLDIVVAADYGVDWYQNVGNIPPVFVPHHLQLEPQGGGPIFIADVDGDGDLDVLSTTYLDHLVKWLENDGNQPPAFAAHTISATSIDLISVFGADLDGDGDLDVLSASLRDDKIAWYENSGGKTPSFVEHVLSVDPDGPSGPLNGILDGPWSVFAADLDEDGDTDILSVSFAEDRIVWFENNGASFPSFSAQTVGTSDDGPTAAIATDVNGDGRLDVVVGSALGRGGRVSFYETRAISRRP